MIKCGIYTITNLENGKIYVGQTTNFTKRQSHHIELLNKNKHHSKHLQHAWIKYGQDNFVFEFIEKAPQRLLIEREQYWMDSFESYDDKVGYNIAKVAGKSKKGLPVSEETKLKMSLAKKGRKYVSSYRPSEELKKRWSISRIGNKNCVGRKLSKETIEKIRIGNIKARNDKLCTANAF